MKQPLISVVLATYNGEKYIREQLDSVFGQTYQNLEVLVFDDGSSDATLDILQDIARHQKKLKVHTNSQKVGVVRNFSRAIEAATGEYIGLCDQDDVWLPEKLYKSLECIQEMEEQTSKETPCLVFTDLKVVDKHLRLLDDSYWHYMGLNPGNHQFHRALVENVATGCTILCNRATRNLAVPIPKGALMHDVWLLLTASYLGEVRFLPEPTVLYRQHSQNAVGASRKGFLQNLYIVLEKAMANNLSLLSGEINQAQLFYDHHQNWLTQFPAKLKLLEAFISLKKKGVLERKYQMVKHGFFRSSLKHTISLLLRA
ncbi:glycosyltransferase family 2 protein [Rufibacter latericius]|uniref:Glycosyltransferase family 2 protein n=1 Tax=Rufibacter latericius TaxID=2487040 RepID=A0A3M9MC94_9BACT|nr:glycosyltransferase family 2 protein [Rufibacter latericius]RNI22453.1 glycosyltransferase family 2 protein [Rufibacter latericius]